jgi:hypothetical protein
VARRLVLLLLPALLVLGACGSDDSGGGAGATTTSAATDDAGAGEKDDQALADDVVLKLADFPSGWTEDEATPEDEDSANDPIDKCFGGEGKTLDENTSAEADSPDFSRGETTTVSSFSAVMKEEKDAEAAMDILASAKLKDCFNQALEEEIKASAGEDEGFTLGDVTLKNASFAKVGEETTALQFVIPISAPGVEVSFYADLVFFRQDRVIGGLFLGNVNTPLASAEGEALAKKMVTRMKAA